MPSKCQAYGESIELRKRKRCKCGKIFLLNKNIFAIISTKSIAFSPELSTDVNKLLITSVSPLLLAV